MALAGGRVVGTGRGAEGNAVETEGREIPATDCRDPERPRVAGIGGE